MGQATNFGLKITVSLVQFQPWALFRLSGYSSVETVQVGNQLATEDAERAALILKGAAGKRLTYRPTDKQDA